MTLLRMISSDIAEDILAISSESVPGLISELRERQQLSEVVHQLNERLFAPDHAVRNSAQAALTHLGFI